MTDAVSVIKPALWFVSQQSIHRQREGSVAQLLPLSGPRVSQTTVLTAQTNYRRLLSTRNALFPSRLRCRRRECVSERSTRYRPCCIETKSCSHVLSIHGEYLSFVNLSTGPTTTSTKVALLSTSPSLSSVSHSIDGLDTELDD